MQLRIVVKIEASSGGTAVTDGVVTPIDEAGCDVTVGGVGTHGVTVVGVGTDGDAAVGD